ncbi:putative septum formation protein [Thiomonas sp. X19]|uniref:Maf family protein n=1 Tax=Thiomonas sp. X19 TaxID=1050370 RepID=UPI000B76795E|nr:Maf family protein [Thiomonas sp. X19]SCC92939.1 putative septum formation protein [Thiomonas sp. X19]
MHAPKHAKPFVYLASASPRRQELLRQIGVDFVLLAPDAKEDAETLERVRPGESARAYVTRVTRLKLQAAVARLAHRGLPPAPILCADTTVALGRRIVGKPSDAAEAAAMLKLLAGHTHRVLTAVAPQWADAPSSQTSGPHKAGSHRREALSTSRVQFAALSDAQLAAYVASGEPFGKAGAYGVQGRAAAFIQHIGGSYSGIMGLPLFETTQLLRQAGIPL